MRLLSLIANAGRKGESTAPPEDVLTNKTLLVSTATAAPTTNYAASTAYYSWPGAPINWSATEASRQIVYPRAGVMRNLRVVVGANTRTGDTIIRLRVNGVNTAMACVIPAGVTGEFIPEHPDVAIAAGDLVDFMMLTGAGTATCDVALIQCEFEGAAAATVVYVKGGSNIAGTGTQSFYSPVTGGPRGTIFGWSSILAQTAKTHMGASGKFTHVQFDVGTNTQDITTKLRLFKNGVDTGVFLDILAGATGRLTANIDVDVAPDDYFHWMLDRTGVASSTIGLVN